MIKAIINRETVLDVEVQYPCLKRGKTTGMIVLFTAPKTGTILSGEDTTEACRAHQKPCYHSEKWVESGFELFDDSITLSNDLS